LNQASILELLPALLLRQQQQQQQQSSMLEQPHAASSLGAPLVQNSLWPLADNNRLAELTQTTNHTQGPFVTNRMASIQELLQQQQQQSRFQVPTSHQSSLSQLTEARLLSLLGPQISLSSSSNIPSWGNSTAPSNIEALLLQRHLHGASLDNQASVGMLLRGAGNPQLSASSLQEYQRMTLPHSSEAATITDEVGNRGVAADIAARSATMQYPTAAVGQPENRDAEISPAALSFPFVIPPKTISTGESDTTRANDGSKKTRKLRKTPFPVTLFDILVDAAAEGNDDIISFVPTGDAFRIHKPETFEKQIISRHFRTNKIDSFKRQLGMYGFDRIPFGPDEGAFAHPDFRRGRRDLAEKMRPMKPGSGASRPAWKPDFSDFWKGQQS
jgi:hypothetical protein